MYYCTDVLMSDVPMYYCTDVLMMDVTICCHLFINLGQGNIFIQLGWVDQII